VSELRANDQHSGNRSTDQWKSVPFEQAIENVSYTNKIQRSDFLSEGAYPIVSQEEGLVNGYWNQPTDVFRPTRPLTVFGDHTQTLKYVDFDFVLGADGIKILQPKSFLLSKFFHYQLQGFTLKSLGYARHYRLLKEKQVVYPSLPEQERIVAILDKAFEEINKAKANAEQSMAGARLLFDNQLREQFDTQWRSKKIVSLTELATDIVDGDHLPPPKSSTGVPFVTISNVDKRSHQIDFTDTYFVSREYFDRLKSNKKPRPGDLLYTVTGSFGIPVKIQDDREFCFQRHIGLIRPKSNVSTSWLYYLVRSPQLVEQANEGATGTAQKTVSLSVLRRFRVPQLSLQEQISMASDLDTLLLETERLEATQFNKLAALDALKQSILYQAFSGNL